MGFELRHCVFKGCCAAVCDNAKQGYKWFLSSDSVCLRAAVQQSVASKDRNNTLLSTKGSSLYHNDCRPPLCLAVQGQTSLELVQCLLLPCKRQRLPLGVDEQEKGKSALGFAMQSALDDAIILNVSKNCMSTTMGSGNSCLGTQSHGKILFILNHCKPDLLAAASTLNAADFSMSKFSFDLNKYTSHCVWIFARYVLALRLCTCLRQATWAEVRGLHSGTQPELNALSLK